MGTSPSPNSSTVGADDALTWRLAPARTPVRTAGVVLAMLAAAGFGFVLTGRPLFALLGPLLLFPVVAQYVFAPSYRLDAESARATWGVSVTQIAWADVRRASFLDEDVLHLSPLAEGDWRGPFRGVTLQLPRDATLRAGALARVRLQCSPHARFDGGAGNDPESG